jgi:hypothetical protein
MVIVLIAVIALLLAAIIYLNIEFYKEKKNFSAKIGLLHEIIVQMSKKEMNQRGQIQLSEQLEQSLKSSNAVLSDDIFKLNYELFEILSQNNLLKK